MRGLHWFRMDLRVEDNSALNLAMQECDELMAIFFITPKAWQSHHESPSKIALLLKRLGSLSTQLSEKGITLLIEVVDAFCDIPDALAVLSKKYSIDSLYFNKQYECNEVQRDLNVSRVLDAQGLRCRAIEDALVVAPGTLMNQQGQYFKVFTPFKKAWWTKVMFTGQWIPQSLPAKTFSLIAPPSRIPDKVPGFTSTLSLAPWPASDAEIEQKLSEFIDKIEYYGTVRDIPSIDGTSQLSPYFCLGALSPRQAISQVLSQSKNTLESLNSLTGAGIWVSELIWREFYHHILFHCPHLGRYKAYQAYTDNFPWRKDEALFAAWCEGRTGFPFVDAAMRQLVQTGWMHNRLRMVTAMFLTKTMFIDWRWGEAFFMKHLLDGNLAANNGGWQWCASTGTDAAPYFRIFNPTSQSERFDPEGIFIRHYCPELRDLPNATIHAPWSAKHPVADLRYPKPVVDYKAMREFVISVFKQRSL